MTNAYLPEKYPIQKNKHLVTIGQKFNKLTVISEPYHKKQSKITKNRRYAEKHQFVQCKCECGTIVNDCRVNSLKRGILIRCKSCKSLYISKKFRKGSLSNGKTKKCARCMKFLNIKQFSNDKTSKDGLVCYCKACVYILNINSKYNIDLEKYIVSINNQCEICGKKFNIYDRDSHKKSQAIHVDHSHNTGEFRGILCKQCNVGIGEARESITILKNMINYLNKHSK